MKVGIFDKKLWNEFSYIVSIICGIVSFVVIFIDIPSNMKVDVGSIFAILLFLIFIFLIIRANRLNEKALKINQTEFVIKFGDLFSEQGLKTIPFNEYFDTEVSDEVISINTLNGIFLKDKVSDVSQVDYKIENDNKKKKNIVATNENRVHGKKTIYKLGTSICFDDYILVAFSKFDEQNRAYLGLADYLSCLVNYWNEVNRIYNGENIVLPLMGTGITRLMCGNSITCQKALEVIIQTFEYSNLSFSHDCKITLVISKKLESEINLYSIGGK